MTERTGQLGERFPPWNFRAQSLEGEDLQLAGVIDFFHNKRVGHAEMFVDTALKFTELDRPIFTRFSFIFQDLIRFPDVFDGLRPIQKGDHGQ